MVARKYKDEVCIVLVGGGGHCRACLEVIEASGRFRVAGIVDQPQRVGEQVNSRNAITHEDSDLPMLARAAHKFLITVGQIESGERRESLFDRVTELGGTFAVVVAPSAYVSRESQIGPGTIIMNGALVNSAAAVGSNCIVNNHAIVEHDVEVGSHSHISTGAIVNGQARIGARCFVGSHAVVAQGVTVTQSCIIGAGTVVIRDLEEPGVYAGNPARRIR